MVVAGLLEKPCTNGVVDFGIDCWRADSAKIGISPE